MSELIRIKNMEKRPFVANLELEPNGEVSEFRPELDPGTGSRVSKESSYTTYRTLTIMGDSVSDPLPDSVLQNCGIQNGVNNKRLRILPHKP